MMSLEGDPTINVLFNFPYLVFIMPLIFLQKKFLPLEQTQNKKFLLVVQNWIKAKFSN